MPASEWACTLRPCFSRSSGSIPCWQAFRFLGISGGNVCGCSRTGYSRVMVRGFSGAVGNTPLIELPALSERLGRRILGKAEFLNPGGSVKDRAAKGILDQAESDAALAPGGTIVEGTAGNTGIALTLLGNERGYKSIIVVPDDQSPEKIGLLRAFGADVRVVPAAPFANKNNYYHVARRIAEEIPGALWANQFENTANRRYHEATTGPEIWRQSGGRLDAFVAAAGTGGTVAGVSSALKDRDERILTVLCDPMGSALYNFVNCGELSQKASPSWRGSGSSALRKTLPPRRSIVRFGSTTKPRSRWCTGCCATKGCSSAARAGSMSAQRHGSRKSYRKDRSSLRSCATAATGISPNFSMRSGCARTGTCRYPAIWIFYKRRMTNAADTAYYYDMSITSGARPGKAVAALRELGFSESESALYVTLARNGPQTAYSVARSIGQSPSNVYRLIESLTRKGALFADGGPSKIVRAVPIEDFIAQMRGAFERQTDVLQSEVRALASEAPDPGTYRLERAEHVLARCRRMLAQASEIVLVDAFPTALRAIESDLERALKRRVRTLVKAYAATDLKATKIVLTPTSRFI